MCDERETLLAYLYEEADPAERGRVEAHLAACDTCRDEIAGLQSVREDLLAWDVPDHGSVWRPFVAARSWSVRDLPAWAMAAAAGVMLALGALGGAAASAVVAHGAVPAATVATRAVAPAPPIVATVTPAALASLEKRVLLVERGARPSQTLATPATLTTADRQAAPLTTTDKDELLGLIREQHYAVIAMTKQVDTLTSLVNDLQTRLQNQPGGQPGGQ